MGSKQTAPTQNVSDGSERSSLPAPEANPWRVCAEISIYSNAWIEVTEYQVTQPDGLPGIYSVVKPQNIALGVVPVDDARNTYLIGQFRFPLDQYSWEIPEGGGDPEKPPQEEAARELREEAGLVAKCWQQILDLHTSNCFTSERALIFLATDLTATDTQPDATEQLQIHRLPLAEAANMARTGKITDAMSVAALLRADELLPDL